MYTVLYYITLGILFAIPVILAVSMFTGLAAGSRRPFWFVVMYFMIIWYFPNASWGLEIQSVGGLGNIYTRGAGIFLLPFVNQALIGLFIVVSISRYFKLVHTAPHNLKYFVWAFAAIIIGNVFIGYSLGYKTATLLSDKGLIHLGNLFLAFSMLLATCRDRRDLNLFINAFLFAAVTRGAYGAVRFAAMGGDPANAYANYEKVDVTLTFFDVNDGFIATVAAFIFAWRLTLMQGSRKLALQLFYWSCVGLEVFIVLFSFRRTSWIGFGMAAVLFALSQPRRTAVLLMVSYVGLGVPVVIAQALKRMVTSSRMQSLSLLEKVAPDLFGSSRVAVESPRLVELDAAWHTIVHQPFFGMGVWGEYNGYGIPLLYFHKNDFTWMHSGILHVWLKCGFIGVTLLVLMWWSYGRFVWQNHKRVDRDAQGVMLAFAAGALFFLPTWLVGTPVIEYRTMQLIGLTLALPYLAFAFGRRVDSRQ